MRNLCWAVSFPTSGHIRLRHNDVIKFSPCIFVIYQYFEKYISAILELSINLEMNSLKFLECFEVSHDHFLQMRKFHPNMDRIWR